MDDLLSRVEIVQSQEDVAAHSLDRAQGNPTIVVPFDERQEIIPQHLERHAHVRPVRSSVLEAVQQPHNLPGARVQPRRGRIHRPGSPRPVPTLLLFRRGRARARAAPRAMVGSLSPAAVLVAPIDGAHVRDLLEDGDLVHGCLCVVLRALLHLERHLGAGGGVIAQPTRGEVTPPEFLEDDVSAVLVGIADADGVVAALAVAVVALVLGLGPGAVGGVGGAVAGVEVGVGGVGGLGAVRLGLGHATLALAALPRLARRAARRRREKLSRHVGHLRVDAGPRAHTTREKRARAMRCVRDAGSGRGCALGSSRARGLWRRCAAGTTLKKPVHAPRATAVVVVARLRQTNA